jgi:hypothetical protein
MGWQTFHRFADGDANLDGLPSGSAYFRFYWREIESTPGGIDFARFDDLLARAHRTGQKLALRIMCTGSSQYMDVPVWLKEQGCRGVEFRYGGRRHWVPDFEDPLFQKAHFGMIRELGRRYNGHPDLDLVDIGSVGLWGEWHMSNTEALDTGKPVPLPSLATRSAIVEAWANAFSNHSVVVLIGNGEGMAQTVALGYGWRADCLGDMGGFSKTWNHMENFYMQQLERTGAGDAWKRGPVAFESCWDMRKWKESGWDVRSIFDYALQCHASYMNNKSAPIPVGTRAEIERFLRRLGYRWVVRTVEHPAAVERGAGLRVDLTWENVGVAPPYRDYRVAVGIRMAGQSSAKPVVDISEASVRGWLPGPHRTEAVVSVPESLGAGLYDVIVGIVDPVSGDPAVRLAITGRDSSGWYPVSRVEVRAAE